MGKECIHICTVERNQDMFYESSMSFYIQSMRLVKFLEPKNKQQSVLVTLVVAFWLCFTSGLSAQGWEVQLPVSSGNLEIQKVIEVVDQGYLLMGTIQENNSDIYVRRVDIDGTLLWENHYGIEELLVDNVDVFSDATLLNNEEFLIVGKSTEPSNEFDAILALRIDALGNEIWSRTYDFGEDLDEEGKAVLENPNGGFIIASNVNDSITARSNVAFVYIDEQGLLQDTVFWDISDSRQNVEEAIITESGQIVIVGSTEQNAPQDPNILAARFDLSGNFLNQLPLIGSMGSPDRATDILQRTNGGLAITGFRGKRDTLSDPDVYLIVANEDLSSPASSAYSIPGTQQAKSITEKDGNNVVITGISEPDPITSEMFFYEIDLSSLNRDIVRSGAIKRDQRQTVGEDVYALSNGSFLAVGYRGDALGTGRIDGYYAKIDNDFRAFNDSIRGTVYIDSQNNCAFDNGEMTLSGWTIAATNLGNGEVFYGYTDAQGNYSILMPQGEFEIKAISPSKYWESCTSFLGRFNEPYESLTYNFGMFNGEDCPELFVDISTVLVEPCEESTYFVTIENKGTSEASRAQLEVRLDDDLTYISSTVIPVSTSNNSFTFDLPNLPINQVFTLQIIAEADCNALDGQSHCVEARVSPDTICSPIDPEWSGASLKVSGVCEADSVVFEITNEGTGTYSEDRNYIVIQDIVIAREQLINPLGEAESIRLSFPRTDSTLRINVPQAIGHPGNSIPTVAVEGCSSTGDYSVGFVNQFEEDDRNPFKSTDCQENIVDSPTKPSFKRAYPTGYGDDSAISQETELKYQINFQNFGNDSAGRVVIRDTLSEFLDPVTLEPGASSHPYILDIYGNGVLRFTFDDINLDVGEAGFVKYRIRQKENNPDDAEICNSAMVIFDYQPADYTEDVCHTVKDSLEILVNDIEIFEPNIEDVIVYPNPINDRAIISIVSDKELGALSLRIVNTEGKIVTTEQYRSKQIPIVRGELPSGVYYFTVESIGKGLLATGKLIIQ